MHDFANIHGDSMLMSNVMADPRQKSLKRRRAARITGLFAFSLLLAGCGSKADSKEGGGGEQEPPTPVTVEPVLRGAIDHVVTADAVLYPVNQANATPKIAAPVRRILVNRGDHVRAG